MKNDLNDLKQLVIELVQRNNLEMPSLSRSILTNQNTMPQRSSYNDEPQVENFPMQTQYNEFSDKPVLISENQNFSKAEEIDENLSLDEKTKELITKALKKHRGKRKDAAEELGISERTLYRKIKEYDIPI